MNLFPMGIDPKGEDEKKEEEKEHSHRKDEAGGEKAHEPRESPSHQNRRGEGPEKLEIGDEGGATARVCDNERVAHASQNAEVDVDERDDEEHEAEKSPLFAPYRKQQFSKHTGRF